MSNDNNEKDFNENKEVSMTIYDVMYGNNKSLGQNDNDNSSVKDLSYRDALQTIRQIINNNHAEQLMKIKDPAAHEKEVKNLITKYISQVNIRVKEINTVGDIVDRIYDDMHGHGFLRHYIDERPDIEEINGNAWDDIEIVTAAGWQKIPEHFDSPQHSIDVIKSLMSMGGIVLDEAKPCGDSFIRKGVRISAAIPPISDEDIGAQFSIRKQSEKVFTRKQLVDWGTTTDDEYDFLGMIAENRVSIFFAGETGSGKTALMNLVLYHISDGKRKITIEEEAREANLIKKDTSGKTISRALHWKVRKSETKSQNIDTAELLRLALRFDPDIIAPAEIRGAEAMTAVESGRTGHTILCTGHANGAAEAYERILTMCKMSGTDLSETRILKNIIDAFPIVIFQSRLSDMSRKVMKIVEVEDYRDGRYVGRTLFRFAATGSKKNDNKRIIEILGEHKSVKKISNKLANKLLLNGADVDLIKKYAENEWQPGMEVDDFDFK